MHVPLSGTVYLHSLNVSVSCEERDRGAQRAPARPRLMPYYIYALSGYLIPIGRGGAVNFSFAEMDT